LWRIAILAIIVMSGFAMPSDVQAQEGRADSQTLRAEMVEGLEEGETDLGPITQPYQRLLVELKEGDREGEHVEVHVGIIDLNTAGHRYQPGDQVYVSYTPATQPGQQELFIITDRVRTTPLFILAGMFAVAIIALKPGDPYGLDPRILAKLS
jgi:uncharacterized membrane protein